MFTLDHQAKWLTGNASQNYPWQCAGPTNCTENHQTELLLPFCEVLVASSMHKSVHIHFYIWRRTWQPTPVFLPGESHRQRSWRATVCGITKSQTWLKWLSMHACIFIFETLMVHNPQPPDTWVGYKWHLFLKSYECVPNCKLCPK